MKTNEEQYSDTKLKQALAKMLPEKVEVINHGCEREPHISYYWKPYQHWDSVEIKDTELLHLCWLVEETLTLDQWGDYCLATNNGTTWADKGQLHATWQQRVLALCKVKGVEIV